MLESIPNLTLVQLIPSAPWLNVPTLWLLGVVLVLLGVALAIGQTLKRQPESSIDHALLRRFNHRVRAWWMMFAILIAGFLLGRGWTVVLFGFVSFWALREFVTMTPTRRGDHRALFWVFFVFTPLQYVLVGTGRTFVDPQGGISGWLADLLGLRGFDFYGMYSIIIPVYASLYIPSRIAFSGDHKRFLERSAKIQAGLLICVYSLSYAPALLHLDLTTYKAPPEIQSSSPAGTPVTPDGRLPQNADASGKRPWTEGSRAGLLFYLILIVQFAELFQHAWGKLLGRRVIAPEINASRTWEGFFGSVATTAILGSLLWWVTPFRVWEAACMATVTSIMGFAGAMTLSAIKRDRGVRDTGTLVQGHAGVLDRIDSLCFAAPVFFHLTRFFFSNSV